MYIVIYCSATGTWALPYQDIWSDNHNVWLVSDYRWAVHITVIRRKRGDSHTRQDGTDNVRFHYATQTACNLKCVNWRSMMWHSGLNRHLAYWHPIWALIWVCVAPFLIQILANTPRKIAEDGAPVPTKETWMKLMAPSFGLAQVQPLQPFREWLKQQIISLCTSSSLSLTTFQINEITSLKKV